MVNQTSSSEPDELDELISFLSDVRSNLRYNAAQLVLGLTGSLEGVESLLPKTQPLLPLLLRILSDPHAIISKVDTIMIHLYHVQNKESL